MKVNWRSVALYYLIACGIAWPIFWIRDKTPDIWRAWNFPLWFNKGWLPAFGPLLGALICLWIFRKTHRRRITFLGTSPIRSAAFVAIALVTLTVVGIGTDEPHLTGLLFAAVYTVYGFLEETGWRGFLQDALQPLPVRTRYLVIGLMWGVWHFTTFAGGAPAQAAQRLALMTLVWIAGSFGLGVAAEKTRSISVTAMLHLIFNLSNALEPAKLIPVLVICITTWVLLLRGWPAPPAADPQ
jgi:membrane protease YdiL (CAAX protease family)